MSRRLKYEEHRLTRSAEAESVEVPKDFSFSLIEVWKERGLFYFLFILRMGDFFCNKKLLLKYMEMNCCEIYHQGRQCS